MIGFTGPAVAVQSQMNNAVSLAEAGDELMFEVELRDFFGNLRSAQDFQVVDSNLLEYTIRLEAHDYSGFGSVRPASFGVREYAKCSCFVFQFRVDSGSQLCVYLGV